VYKKFILNGFDSVVVFQQQKLLYKPEIETMDTSRCKTFYLGLNQKKLLAFIEGLEHELDNIKTHDCNIIKGMGSF